MKKRIISLGLLATVLSFTSCVKDNESDSVVAQRQAQTEKLKADAAKLLADSEVAKAIAKLNEAEAAVKQAEAKHQELLNEKEQLSVEVEKAGHDDKVQAKINENKVKLLASERSLKEAEGKQEARLKDLEVQIAREKQNAELALVEIKAKLSAEKAEKIKEAYEAYIDALNDVADNKKELIEEKKAIADAEYDFNNSESRKERLVLAAKADIAAKEREIEILRATAKGTQNPSELAVKLVDAKKVKDAADKVVETKGSALDKLEDKVAEVSGELQDKLEETDFYKAAKYLNEEINGRAVTSGLVKKESKEEDVKRGNHMTSKEVYSLVIPSFDSNAYDLAYENSINRDLIKEKEEALKEATNTSKEAAKELASAKSEYKKDPTQLNKELWQNASVAYYASLDDVETKTKELQDAKDAAKDLQKAKEDFYSDEKRAEATKLVDNLNNLEVKKAEAYLDKKDAEDKAKEAQAAVKAIETLQNKTLVGISEDLKKLEDKLVDLKKGLADTEKATPEDSIEKAKNELARKEGLVKVLEAKAEALRKIYEDLLKTL